MSTDVTASQAGSSPVVVKRSVTRPVYSSTVIFWHSVCKGVSEVGQIRLHTHTNTHSTRADSRYGPAACALDLELCLSPSLSVSSYTYWLAAAFTVFPSTACIETKRTVADSCWASRDTNILHMRSFQLIPFIPQRVFQHAHWIIASLLSLFLSLTFCYLLPHNLISLMSMLCLCVLNQLSRLYQEGPMTLSTAAPGSKACWESSSCKGGIGACCDWLLEFCMYVCVCMLMCSLVFLGLQTHRQPVLANGIYGKMFK